MKSIHPLHPPPHHQTYSEVCFGLTASRERSRDLGDSKEVADPDSQRRGGGRALQARGLPARHRMNGAVCDEAGESGKEEGEMICKKTFILAE